jgi:hypothetical protein
VKRTRGGPPPRARRRIEQLEVGQKIRDTRHQQEGVVVDSACQYAHPKADPVYSYLVRWEDGQVLAISEAALSREHGIEVLD